jgi:TonB family protein
LILRLKRLGVDIVRPGAVIALGDSRLVGTPGDPLEFGRFLLASAGLHLMLALTVTTVGLHGRPIPEKPLIVRLVEAEAPKPLPARAEPARARATKEAAARPATEPVGPKEIPQLNLSLPSVGRSEPVPPRVVEMIDNASLGERRVIASERATEALVKDLGLPSRAPTAGSQNVVGGGIRGPKSVGVPGSISMVPGTLAGKGLESGPTLLGGGGGPEGGPGQAGRGGERRLGAALTAPLAPTVTVRPRQGAGGRGTGGEGNGAADGRFASPNYGTNPLPKYPPLAREKGYEGTVYLRVQVRPDGRAGKLAIDRSSGHEILDRAAVDSVKGWTFLPARKAGKPVESWVLLPVKFMLD